MIFPSPINLFSQIHIALPHIFHIDSLPWLNSQAISLPSTPPTSPLLPHPAFQPSQCPRLLTQLLPLLQGVRPSPERPVHTPATPCHPPQREYNPLRPRANNLNPTSRCVLSIVPHRCLDLTSLPTFFLTSAGSGCITQTGNRRHH